MVATLSIFQVIPRMPAIKSISRIMFRKMPPAPRSMVKEKANSRSGNKTKKVRI